MSVTNYEAIRKAIEKVNKTDEKDIQHFKGYMYDSLVYRYIVARKQMAEYDFAKSKSSHDRNFYYELAERDISKFCQILNEAIGEHD